MAASAVPKRFLDRLRVPADPVETHRVEWVLATARVLLAVASLLAIYLDPTEPQRYATLAYSLLVAYAAFSVGIAYLLRARPATARPVRWVALAIDMLWAAALTMFTEGPNSPFFVLFVFVLLGAAYRWGFRETVLSAGAAALLINLEAAVITPTLGRAFGSVEGEFDVNRLVIRNAYLLLMGVLLGYLAEKEKELRAETTRIARIAGEAQVSAGLRGTLQAVVGELLQVFGAHEALLATQERRTGRAFLWRASAPDLRQKLALYTSELESGENEKYFFPMAADTWHARQRRDGSRELLALDPDGSRVRPLAGTLPDVFPAAHPFESLLVASFPMGGEWSVRLFLLDVSAGTERDTEMRFLRRCLNEVSPAIYNVYLLRRLRARAGAIERARMARELHDGAIQSLLAAEMQMDVLRRQVRADSVPLSDNLEQIQNIVHQEVLNLRELMEQMRPIDSTAGELVGHLADTVDRFRRQSGISVRFISDQEEVHLPTPTCRELVRIVQEALVNVRKHSGAHNVIVSFTRNAAGWKLVIDDDGKGFDFSGRLNHEQLDALRRGPVVIKERVRSIGGELTVESVPSRGSRLEISLR